MAVPGRNGTRGLLGSPERDVQPSAVKILLVDDEPKNLLALEAVLAGDGRILTHASSGEEALMRLLEEDFAVILLDVNMPGMDGFETAALVRDREKSRDTPIIFLTAAIQGETYVTRGYSLGAVDYIFKPFEPEILRSKVAVFVQLFRKTEEVKRQAQQLVERTLFL
jgi:CheY-like chemotaxis protein